MITERKEPTVEDLLVLAKSKIDQPEKWTKGASARDANYAVCRPSWNAAACFCSVGALQLASDMLEGPWTCALFEAADLLLTDSLTQESRGSYIKYNDQPETTHEDVMALFDRAIEKARAPK